ARRGATMRQGLAMRRVASAWALVSAIAGSSLAEDPPLTLPGGASVSPTRRPARPAPLFGGDPLRPAFRPAEPSSNLPRLEPTPPTAPPPAAAEAPPPLTMPAQAGVAEAPPNPFVARPSPAPRRGPGLPPPLALESTPLDGLDPLPDPKRRSISDLPEA